MDRVLRLIYICNRKKFIIQLSKTQPWFINNRSLSSSSSLYNKYPIVLKNCMRNNNQKDEARRLCDELSRAKIDS